MAKGQSLGGVLQRLRRAAVRSEAAGLAESELLERYRRDFPEQIAEPTKAAH